MKSNRMGPTVVTTLLMGLASCGTSIQDLQPGSATGAAQGNPPARLVSEADYTRYGPNMISFCGAGAAARAQPGFTGTPRTSFYTAEGIVAVTDVTWPESTSDAGLHHVDWRLFQGDTVLKEKHSDERLCSKSSRILSHLSAGSFAPGTYRFDLLLDQKPFATLPFKLLAAQTPAPLTTLITGPKCKGAAQTETARPHLKPVNQVRPGFPSGAADRHESGCAVVSIIVDNDGHPSGVRVDGEYPEHAGFGDMAARAYWLSTFPPGHGGETTRMTVHFNMRN
jgi:hypothetical protein